LATTTDDQPRVLFTEDDLLAASPEKDLPPGSDLDVYLIIPHPDQPNQFFILAFVNSETAYLFSYDVAADVIDFHFRRELDYLHSLSASPDGRFLLLAGTTLEDGRGASDNWILLYDTARREFEQFGMNGDFFSPANIYDWSADGDWLAVIPDDLSLLLIAPDHDYQQVIPHSLGQCTNAVWLDK
jgi:dipeptidyl aminopeptidase/acylaminoacyl peptidase